MARMSDSPKTQPAGDLPSEAIDFADLNFKLAVIQELMYEQELLTPQFVLADFLEEHVDREIDLSQEITEPIPEVLEYFRSLPVPSEYAPSVEELYQDGGNDIYLEIAPQWGGDDSTFDIADFTDTRHFPNLTSMTLLGVDDEVIEGLRRKGIDAQLL